MRVPSHDGPGATDFPAEAAALSQRFLQAVRARGAWQEPLRAWLATGDERAQLALALCHALSGREEPVLALARAVETPDALPAGIAASLAGALLALGEPARALRFALSAARRERSLSASALEVTASTLTRCGATRTANRLLLAGRASRQARLWVAQGLFRRGCWGVAIEQLEALSRDAPLEDVARVCLGHALARAGQRERAREVLSALPRGAALEPVATEWYLQGLLLAGDLAALREVVRGPGGQGLDALSLARWRCRLALWSGAQGAAEREHLARVAPEEPATARFEGIAAVLRGSLEEATAHLRRAAEKGDAEALHWLGELAWRAGDLEPARAWLRRAIETAEEQLPTAALLWPLVDASVQGAELTTARSLDRARPLLKAFGYDALAETEEPTSLAVLARAVDEILAAQGANRSALCTRADLGALRAVPVEPEVRTASKVAIDSVEYVDEASVHATLDELTRRHAGSSLPLCHRGELRLWVGDFEGARADLEGAIAKEQRTRWAYIGLTVLHSLCGRHAEALALSARGIEVMGDAGPAVYAYRGEALRRAGRLAEALEDLRRAAELHPGRLSSWCNLAACAASMGDEALAREAWGELRARAPLAAAVAEEAVGSPASPGAAGEALLGMMRGNRSSGCVLYFPPGHEEPVSAVGPFAAPTGKARADALRGALEALAG